MSPNSKPPEATEQEIFYNAWHYLAKHHDWALSNLDIHIAKVNPETGEIDNDTTKNTHIEYWLESGPSEISKHNIIVTHDCNLDCGGNTFEQAIIKLAKLVHKYY